MAICSTRYNRVMDKCFYCGQEGTLQREHVIPLCRGGKDRKSNIVRACVPCNMEKCDLTPEEWRGWRITRGRSWPPVWDYAQIAAGERQHAAAQEYGWNQSRDYPIGSRGREDYDNPEYRALLRDNAKDQWAPGGSLRELTWRRDLPGGRYGARIVEFAKGKPEGFTPKELREHLGLDRVKECLGVAIHAGLIIHIAWNRYALPSDLPDGCTRECRNLAPHIHVQNDSEV
jgi:hypothetical protein